MQSTLNNEAMNPRITKSAPQLENPLLAKQLSRQLTNPSFKMKSLYMCSESGQQYNHPGDNERKKEELGEQR